MDDLMRSITLAEKLADVSGEVIRQYFRRSHLPSETKEGQVSAIVTLADREAEAVMVDILLTEAPGDGILREEGENIISQTGRTWVLDPIDGTASFVKGFPVFGTLIGLVELDSDIPLLGIANQPILQERWLGIRGKPTLFNHQPLMNAYAKDRNSELAEACLTFTTPLMFITDRQKAIAAKLQQYFQRQAFGGDCYNYLALASGWSSMPMVILEADMQYYDFCALIPVVEGVGGTITDWSGRRLGPESTEVLATSSPLLLEQTLGIIREIERNW
jgi:inositol-phosphate phosphatase/L-galactose 1-phosphate phosphatase/histidinol-phosphatase